MFTYNFSAIRGQSNNTNRKQRVYISHHFATSKVGKQYIITSYLNDNIRSLARRP
jgi:hypothetical protein